MNDYGMGAMEALSWAQGILETCKSIEDFEKARREINHTVKRLMEGAAINFRKKIELI